MEKINCSNGRRFRILFWISALVVLSGLTAVGQTTILLSTATNGSTNTGCTYNFYDSGGAGANYGNNQNNTITFCAPVGEVTRFEFRSFLIGASDTLFIYDGATTSSTLIGSYRSTSPGVVISTGTCMTFRFKSDASTTAQGWFAQGSCMTPYSCTSNLLLNGTFDTDFSNWTATNGTLSNQLRYQMDGGPRIVWLQHTSGTATISQTVTGIQQGVTYTLHFYAGTHETAYDHFMGLKFYNASNTLLASNILEINHDVDPYSNLGYYSLSLAAPTGATYAIVEGTATGDYLKVDGVCLTGNFPTCTSDTLCQADPAHVFSIAPVAGAVSYTWFIDGNSSHSAIVSGQGTTSITVNLTTLSLATHTFQVTANGADGCSSPPSCLNILLSSPGTASASGSTVCVGETINLTATPTGGFAPYSYSWTGPASFTSTAQNPTRTNATLAMAGTYFVTITDGAGCTATTSTTVTVNSAPTISVNNNTICIGGTGSLTATYTGGTGSVSTFQWQSSPDNSVWTNESGGTSTTFTTPALSSTTYFRVTVTMSTGCTAVSAAGLVTVVADPSISAQPTGGTICVGGSQILSATATGGVSLTYQWQFFNGTSWGNVANGSPAGSTFSGNTSNSLTVSGITATGSHQFRLLVNDATNGCGQAISSTATIIVVADPAISVQPTGGTICVGGSQVLSATATGGNSLTYQWQFYNGTSWGNVANGSPAGSTFSGNTSNSLTVSGITATGSHQFRLLVNDAANGCGQAISSTATIIVVADPAISVQPTGGTICVGGSQVLSATATGGNSLTYQWQFFNGTTWGNVANGSPSGSTFSGNTTNSLTVSGITATGSHQFRLLVNDAANGCGQAISSTATIIVVADPAISVQPTGGTICVGGSQVLSATATGGNSLTYQWQFFNGTSWGNVANGSPAGSTFSGNTTNSLTVNGITATGSHQFRLLVNDAANGCGQAISSTATIIVNSDPTISISGAATICSGGTATLTSTTGNGAGTCTVQWQSSPDGSTAWANISGATSSNFTTPVLTTSTFYRALYSCTGNGCDGAVSNSQQIAVVADPSVNLVGANVAVCSGGGVTLSASVSGGTGAISYQWQDSPDGTTFSTIAGATNINYTTPALTATTYYRVLISFVGNGCESATSASASVTVVADPTISISGNPNICDGGTVTMTATTTGGTGTCTIQWQQKIGVSTWLPISGANSATYTTPVLTATTTYRAMYTCSGGGCDAAVSNEHTITVVPDLSISSQPNDIFECVGGADELTVSISNGSGSISYQWQSSPNNSTWANISGATASNFPPPSSSPGINYYRVIISASNAGCEDAISNPATVTITPDLAILTPPANISECVGGTDELTVSTSFGSGTTTYQWQSSSDNSSWADVSGAVSNIYRPPSDVAGTTYFRVIISASNNGCDNVTSASATVVVSDVPVVTVAGLSDVCVGSQVLLTATATGGTGTCTFQWQEKTGPTTWSDISGATGNTYTTPSLSADGSFRAVRICSGSGCCL